MALCRRRERGHSLQRPLRSGSRYRDEVVVLFAHEEDYRQFAAAEARIASVHSQGYASEGLAILYTGEHQPSETVSILIHELVHLLNRRVFPAENAPWLEEGLAEDLAFCRVRDDGRLAVGTLSGDLQDSDTLFPTLTGPTAHLAALYTSWSEPTRPSVAALTEIDQEPFINPETRAIHYAESAFLIRYLLDGGDSESREGFLRYLQRIAASDMPESVSLWQDLESDPGKVESGLYRFVRNQARANGIQ